jgi:hypothetical protein
LQPWKPRKSENETISFIGCDFSEQQKWTFKPVQTPGTEDSEKGNENPGQFVHSGSGRCLTLASKNRRRPAEKSVLSFLASIALETGLKTESPTLEDCKAVTEMKDEENQTQLWTMNLPAEWENFT